jgi:Nineteen complex-related protein 2
MNSAFANRRKARKVGGEEDEGQNANGQGWLCNASLSPERECRLRRNLEPVISVRRPTNSKPKQKSKLRLSFGPRETSMADDNDDDGESEVITPKRPGLGRRMLENTAIRRPLKPSASTEHLSIRVGPDHDRPSYSQDYLQELRDSTPSTPKDTGSLQTGASNSDKAVDVAAKFGDVMEISVATAIPSEAEIREKKARRARLAKEQDFISLDDVGDDNNWSINSIDDKKAKPETRLVPDDEDFAEGFDEFVQEFAEDGKISLGRKAERLQQKRQRETMRDLIDEAEATSDDNDSDAERRAAYEVSQTQAAIGSMGSNHQALDGRPKTPPKITPLPRLTSTLDRLRLTLATLGVSKRHLVNRMEELRKEKANIATREVEVQTLIKEAGENYEKLRTEAGLVHSKSGSPDDNHSDRGLDNLGTTTPGSSSFTED